MASLLSPPAVESPPDINGPVPRRGFRPPDALSQFAQDVQAATPSVRAANGMDPKTGAPIPGWKRPAPVAPAPPAQNNPVMSGPAGIGAAFAATLPKSAAPPTAPAAPLLPPAGPAAVAQKPRTFGHGDFRNQPFGTGMNGEDPMVPYQGSLGNGAPKSFRPMNPGDSGPASPGPAMSEGDFVDRNMADASPNLGGRHHDRIRTGKFRGRLPSEARWASRDAYANMGAN